MRLTLKITMAVLLGVALIFSAYSYLSIQREREQLKKNLSREARHIGESLRVLVVELWQQRGENAAIAFLGKANRGYQETQVRWVWVEEDAPEHYKPSLPLDQLDAVRNEETVALLAGSDDGRDFLVTYLPLLIDGRRIGAIELTEPMDDLHDYVQESLRRSAMVIGASVVSGVLLMGMLGSIWVDRPMRKLHAQAARIGEGDLSPSDNLSGGDELAALSSTIERMREQLAQAREAEDRATAEKFEALEKLRHTERLATLGQLSAGMAHELGTPLNVISGRAKLISGGDLETEDCQRSARIIGEQAERMTTIMRQLLSFARRGEARKQAIDLNTVLRGIEPLLEPMAHKQGVEISFDSKGQSLMAQVDPGQLQQVLLNLALNGIQSMPDGGRLTMISSYETVVKLPEQIETGSQSWFRIRIKDDGVGMDRETLAKIFDPFFTTKEVGQGTGLGLSIAHGIIEEHGGWIEAESDPGNGSCFSIYLPGELA